MGNRSTFHWYAPGGVSTMTKFLRDTSEKATHARRQRDRLRRMLRFLRRMDVEVPHCRRMKPEPRLRFRRRRPMRLYIRTSNTELPLALRAHVQGRIGFALARFEGE